MRNDVHDEKKQLSAGGSGPLSGRANGLLNSSFRAFSGYLKVGASTVASTVRSAANSVVEREIGGGGGGSSSGGYDQVLWSGFDKLECDGGISRRVLLLGYLSGFQVWDVEEADNVHELALRHDGPVSVMQILPIPIASKRSEDKFHDSRPVLVMCVDFASGSQDSSVMPCNGGISNGLYPCNRTSLPTVVRFYSLRSQSYLHVLKFRSGICSVKCSSRVIAVLQEAQIHCFNATTLEKNYAVLTNLVVTHSLGFGGLGHGPLAVGARWLAYSGSPVVGNPSRVTPQHVTSTPSNGIRVAHYAKESSKHLAAGIVTLGDIGYKKLSRYCSELLPDSNSPMLTEALGSKGGRTVNGHSQDIDHVGMVVVRDIVSKSVVAQFRAHRSPVVALCFDSSGTLLVTASVKGHNINVYRISPELCGYSSESDSGLLFMHLYTLQRGLTNAVIQDVSFSDDSNWIAISSSRGTSHLFAISPYGGLVNFETADAAIDARNWRRGPLSKATLCWSSTSGDQMPNQQDFYTAPITLSAVNRIRSGSGGWKDTVSGAAAAATGRTVSSPGAIASSFHNFKGKYPNSESGSSKSKYHLLVFSPSGSLTQYMLRLSTPSDSVGSVPGSSTAHNSSWEDDPRLAVQAIQKWNICQKQSQRDREDNMDIYGENGMSFDGKISHEGYKNLSSVCSDASSATNQKYSHEERYNMYISEAELQMHQAENPIWARPEMYFQCMTVDGVIIDHNEALGGEIEIERFQTFVIEAKPKNLIPVSDYIQTSKLHQARPITLVRFDNGQLLHQSTGLSEIGRLSCRGRSPSLDSSTDWGSLVPAHCNDSEEIKKDGIPFGHRENKGFVNNDCSKTQKASVNNRGYISEGQLNIVNTNREGLKMGKQWEDEDDEFD